nr:hypothetical protein L204_02174 [Cryptococcus depauperatus CBS 7855]
MVNPAKSYEDIPAVKTTAVSPKTPYFGRFFFHIGTVAVMAQGFLAMKKITLGQFIRPQGSMEVWDGLDTKETHSFHRVSAVSDHTRPSMLRNCHGSLRCKRSFTQYKQQVYKNSGTIKLVKRVFLLVSLPAELVISLIYWSIIIIAPELMLPPTSPSASQGEASSSSAQPDLFRIPLWMDLSMHLLPTVALLLDFFLLEKKYPKPFSTYIASLLAAMFGIAYGVWVEHCASINGVFPYPFLTIMNFEGRVATYVGATVAAWLVFRGLNGLHK